MYLPRSLKHLVWLILPVCAFSHWDNSLLRPFVMNHWKTSGSIIDLSFLHEGPAGKDGFIRVQDGHLAKPDGSRMRFWGVHLTDWSPGSVLLPPKENVPM